MSQIKKIYYLLPEMPRQLIDIIYGSIPNRIKFGKKYREMKRFLEKSQWWSFKEHKEYQNKEIKKLLVHAFENTQYYHELFNRIQYNPYEYEDSAELNEIPFMDKNLVIENFEKLVARNYSNKNRKITTTGGTSGNQLKFYEEKNYYQVEWPYIELLWGRVGYSEKSKVASLRNHSFKNNEVYKYNWKDRQLILDNFHLNDENIRIMLTKLFEYNIEYIHTYPSAIMTVCEFIRRTDYKFNHNIKAILATSENLYPGQREFIEETLNTKVYTFYGHSERACIAGWCEKSQLYHIQSEYGYLELIDDNGEVIEEPNKRGEIVCTGFNNYAMPFIRYRTGDYASYSEINTCSCGRKYRLLNRIEGRWMQEVLVGNDNSKISITALNMHSDIFDNVKYYQLFQEKAGYCKIKIVKADGYTTKDELKIIEAFNKKIGKAIIFQVKYVDDIEKTKRGKFKYLIQKIPNI